MSRRASQANQMSLGSSQPQARLLSGTGSPYAREHGGPKPLPCARAKSQSGSNSGRCLRLANGLNSVVMPESRLWHHNSLTVLRKNV